LVVLACGRARAPGCRYPRCSAAAHGLHMGWRPAPSQTSQPCSDTEVCIVSRVRCLTPGQQLLPALPRHPQDSPAAAPATAQTWRSHTSPVAAPWRWLLSCHAGWLPRPPGRQCPALLAGGSGWLVQRTSRGSANDAAGAVALAAAALVVCVSTAVASAGSQWSSPDASVHVGGTCACRRQLWVRHPQPVFDALKALQWFT
jgi:hypothetical protein